MSGAAGYYYAVNAVTKRETSTQKKPKYGTPEDFKRAIEELRALFPSGDIVSTDPDDLSAHGLSPYVWHTGMCLLLILLEY